METRAPGRVTHEIDSPFATTAMPELPVCELLPPASGDVEHRHRNAHDPTAIILIIREIGFMVSCPWVILFFLPRL
jgi:hypothetical protein